MLLRLPPALATRETLPFRSSFGRARLGRNAGCSIQPRGAALASRQRVLDDHPTHDPPPTLGSHSPFKFIRDFNSPEIIGISFVSRAPGAWRRR